MVTLCNGDIDRPLKFEIFDYEKSGKHVFMGLVNASVRDLVSSNGAWKNVFFFSDIHYAYLCSI